MLIQNFGFFWRYDEVEWSPGRGGRFQLLGRSGAYRGTLRVADFRDQRGLYVLYGNYGPYYVGLARGNGGIGARLRAHDADKHSGHWDRFCWFGFRRVLTDRDERNLWRLANPSELVKGDMNSVIGDMEALLIKALGCPSNVANMNFPGGEEWVQIKYHETDKYLDRVDAR